MTQQPLNIDVLDRPPARLSRRRSVLSTQEKIIEAAGPIFAAKGYQGTTGKEICEQAGVNTAAINYHFGSLEALYHEVLAAAYDRMVGFDELAQAITAKATPEERLLAFYETMASSFMRSLDHSWPWRVVSREAMSPSTEIDKMREAQLIPKMALLRDLVGEILHLPADHKMVVQSCLSIMGPLVMLQVGDWTAMNRAFPGFDVDESNAVSLARHFYTFTLGGLRAVAESLK